MMAEGVNVIYNERKLRGRIAESGLRKYTIASELGLSRQGLLNKISGVSEFTVSEISELQVLLNLTDEERDEIFFCNNVG